MADYFHEIRSFKASPKHKESFVTRTKNELHSFGKENLTSYANLQKGIGQNLKNNLVSSKTWKR